MLGGERRQAWEVGEHSGGTSEGSLQLCPHRPSGTERALAMEDRDSWEGTTMQNIALKLVNQKVSLCGTSTLSISERFGSA